MLKIWKQAWRKDDATTVSRSSSLARDATDDFGLSPFDTDEPTSQSLISTIPYIIDHEVLGPIISSERIFKRARSQEEELSIEDSCNWPVKRHRSDDVITACSKDHSNAPESELSANSRIIMNRMFDNAKKENTIVVLESSNLKMVLLSKLLLWSSELDRTRPLSTVPRRRRVAVIVIDKHNLMDNFAETISEETGLSIGIFPQAKLSIAQWSYLMTKDVVISETNVLLEALTKGSMAMSQIHLLVIDDVQAIRDDENHSIIQMMRDFYRATDVFSRPKIFGMINPSPETKFYFDLKTLEMEQLLNANVFDENQEILVERENRTGKPSELVVFYDPQFREKQTALFKQLRTQDPGEQIFRRYFRNARSCFNSLGACASDLVWRRTLKEIEATTAMVYEEEEELETGSITAIAKSQLNMWITLKNWDFNMPNIDPTSRGFNVTPKFAKLVRMLQACELYGDSFRGIVFVHKRIVADIITDMLRMLDDHIKFLRPQVLPGQALLSDQRDTLEGFRTGTYNLLILTKASEDLEIFPANIVIRFDLFESYVSYAFCRARTNGSQSHLIHMAERGSDMHRRMVSHLARLDRKMETWMESFCKGAVSAIPPSELRETIDPYRSDSEDEENDPSKFIQDPTTSGRIYSQDATTVLYRFVSRLQTSKNDNVIEPLFEFEEFLSNLNVGQSFICTVLLPRGSPVTRISGPPCSSKSMARRMACYQMCMALSQQGYLDCHLFPRAALPTSRRQRRGYMSAHVEEELSDEDDTDGLPDKAKQGHKSTSTRPYPVKSPDFWSNALPIMRGCLYPTVILPDMTSEETSTLYAPLLLLTRLPLPSLPSFKLFFSGMPRMILFRRGAAFNVDEDQLRLLHRYTLRICRAVANKPFVCSLQNMSYFIAPLPKTWTLAENMPNLLFPDVGKDIQWEKVELSAKQGAIALKTQDLSTLEEDVDDAIVQDRWIEFTRRYFCIRMRPDLNPLSKPEDSLRENNFENLLDYCRARRKDFDGLQNYQQPLIEVECVSSLVNHLSPTCRPFENRRRAPAKYLIPELCAKFTVPASTFRTFLLLPSILRRIDDLLLVKELNANFFDHAIREHHLLAAISAPSAGVEFDYERLELLGDAYLKYLSSVYLFVTNPSQHEGDLHVARQRIISNQSLLRNADRSGLPQFIQSKPFTAKSWVPPNWHVSCRPRIIDDTTFEPACLKNEKGRGKAEVVERNQFQKDAVLELQEDGRLEQDAEQNAKSVTNSPNKSLLAVIDRKESNTEQSHTRPTKRKLLYNADNVQWLGDKAVADVAEAIIGAAFASGGREVALKVTKALNVPVPHVDQWSDFSHKALAPPPDVTIKLKECSVKAVQAIIGTNFNHPHLLAQALTHASIPGNEMACYERFEFIGDAILDFLVIRHIFDRDETLSPGALTLLKGAMVSNAALAAVCVWSGLHEHLMLESYTLANHIQLYAKELKMKQSEEYASAKRENRSAGQYWLETEPPKALSDVIESILGAVYVSDNFSSVGAEAFFKKVLKPFYDQHITLYTLSHHPTKILFELFQSQGCQNFEILKEHITSDDNNSSVKCDVIVHDIILSSAMDTTSTFAARRASLWALDALEGDPDFMFRTCDCRALSQIRKAEKKASKRYARGNLKNLDEKIVPTSEPEVRQDNELDMNRNLV